MIKDHANRCCKLIDVSVPSDRKPQRKSLKNSKNTKILRLKPRECGGEGGGGVVMKTDTVSVIVGALRLIREGMDQNLGKIPGASNINEMQKIMYAKSIIN